ncbi:MAG: bifunctional ornithine acetyltransferase/N-acetylglutamate synthase, partial [Clostridia bacterium]|nr:bifunctional ornithine acetyltransferase/N-acetylglutamate synthase [Clostridia bacterium]
VDLSSSNGSIAVCRGGAGIGFSEDEAARILAADEIFILINLHQGNCSATAWGCDLTYDYVRINGDYRT